MAPPPRTARLMLAGLALALFPASAPAQTALPSAYAPIPSAKPQFDAFDGAGTGPLADKDAAAKPGLDTGVATLKAGLDSLSDGNLASVRAMRDSLPAHSLDRHVLAWALALSGHRELTSDEIAAAADTLHGWPGMAAVAANLERAMLRESPEPADVVKAFGAAAPQTREGVVLLARSHLALGDPEAARAALVPFWRSERLDAADEAAIIREFGSLIPAAAHRIRMEQMLYHQRANAALRVAGLAEARELAEAWTAVLRREKGASRLLETVPETQRSAGWHYARAKHLRWSGKFAEAAEAVLEAPKDPAALIDPDAWWVERRVLARELLDHGDPATAYRVAAAHSAESPAMVADAEFHAGWLALTALDNPASAYRHFSRIADIAEGPASLSRAWYWLGRAAEAGGPGEAKTLFEKAAIYGTSFYGQLAAARLGRDAIPAAYPEPTPSDRIAFAAREPVQAIRRLEEAGHARRADILYRALAAELTSPGELALLAAMGEKRGDHHLALRVGKIAASRGLEIGALAHPVGAIPASAKISGAGKALAYAVARQESEFRVSAISGAGARGLLQLLPGTARDMARSTGLPYDKARLTADAGYNATLGAAYLSQQLGRFDGSYILTLVGYNAGPQRAEEWVERYGDPRGMEVDEVVDWIERIPYTETRNYVQRVMENYQVYRMRLSGAVDVAGDLTEGR